MGFLMKLLPKIIYRIILKFGGRKTLKFFIRISDLSLQMANMLACKLEGGTHPKHRIMRYHEWFMQRIRPDMDVLDIGSSRGELTFDLSKAAKSVTGVEIDENNYRYALNNNSGSNIEYILGDINQIDLEKEFDVVVMSNVLEHIEDRAKILNKVNRLTKDSGKLLIRVPAFDRWWWIPYKKEIGVEWRSDASHFIEYTEEGLRQELKEADFKILSLEKMWGEIYVECEKQ